MTDTYTALVERLNKSILFTEDGASSSLPYKASEAITTLQSELAEARERVEIMKGLKK